MLPVVFANTYFQKNSFKKFCDTQVLIHSLPLKSEEQIVMEGPISLTNIER